MFRAGVTSYCGRHGGSKRKNHTTTVCALGCRGKIISPKNVTVHLTGGTTLLEKVKTGLMAFPEKGWTPDSVFSGNEVVQRDQR